MNIKRAYLIGLNVYYTKNSNSPFSVERVNKKNDETLDVANPYHAQIAIGKLMPDAKMLLVRPDGFLTAMHAIYTNDRPIPEFWSDMVLACYLTTEENIDYFTWKVIIELNREAIPELVKLNAWECTKKVDSLLEAVFPGCIGEQLKISDSHPKYRSVFYLEPEKPICTEGSNICDGAINDLLFTLDQKDTACEPHMFLDIILFHDIGVGTPDRRLLAVSLKPLPIHEGSKTVILPATIIDFVLYLNFITQLQHMALRLRMLPFYKTSVRNYIKQLKSDKYVSIAYEERFLNDRHEELSEQFRVIQLADQIKRKTQSNYISLYEESNYSVPIWNVISDPHISAYRYNVLRRITQAFFSVNRELRETSEIIRGRTNAIADYLRDTVVVDATHVNLSLQKSIKRFTVLAVLITFTALIIAIIGVLPQEIKQLIYAKLLEAFMGR